MATTDPKVAAQAGSRVPPNQTTVAAAEKVSAPTAGTPATPVADTGQPVSRVAPSRVTPQAPPPGQTVPLPADPAEQAALRRTKGVKTTGDADDDTLIPVIALRKTFTSDGRTLEAGERAMIQGKDFNSTVHEKTTAAKVMREAPNTVRQRQLVDSGAAEAPDTDEETAKNT